MLIAINLTFVCIVGIALHPWSNNLSVLLELPYIHGQIVLNTCHNPRINTINVRTI